MKKLLFVTSSYPYGMGEASFIRPEMISLSEKFQVTVVSRNAVDEQTSQVPENVRVLRYAFNSSSSMVKYALKTVFSSYIYKEISYLIKKKKFSLSKVKRAFRNCTRAFHFADYLEDVRKDMGDNVVLYTYWNDYSVLSLSMIKRKGDKLVSRAHRRDLYLLPDNDFYLPLKELSNKKTDAVVFISEEGKEYYENNFNVPSQKMIYRLGVSEQQVREYTPQENSISILSLSYVVPIKRIDRIIDAIAKIDNVKVNWVHIGDGKLMGEISERAKSAFSQKENVTYCFKGAMDNVQALEYIRNNHIDLFVNTSDSEGLPVSMMEAMSFSIPVLGLDVGGVSEIISHNENGFLLPENPDVQMITDTICNFANLTVNEKQKMRENALNTWKEKYNSKKNYDNFAEMLYCL